REYVEAYEDRHDLTVHLAGEAVAAGLPAFVAFQLLRILQEALAHVRQHAHAHNAWIRFEMGEGHRLEMSVCDGRDGCEPRAASVEATRRTFGLASMRERVESLGGELRLESHPGAGTRVSVSVPCKAGAGGNWSGVLAPAAR